MLVTTVSSETGLRRTSIAAGTHEKIVAPTLAREQIAELNKYVDTLPFFSTDRKEFREAARMAEERLFRIEISEAARKEADPLRARDFPARAVDESPSHTASNNDRSDRDTYSRGR